MTKTAMIFGTFDGIHAGHISLIEYAKDQAHMLVAVVARDETVVKIKGKRPLHSQDERAAVLTHIREIDDVRIGNSEDKLAIVREVKPNVIVLGYDQEAFIDILEKAILDEQLDIELLRAKAYAPERLKSGKLREAYQDNKPI